MTLGTKSPSILVVGGSSSIGNAIADNFISDGFHVISTFKTSLPEGLSGESHWMELDLASESSINGFVRKLESYKSTILCIFMVSAILPGKNLATYEASEMDAVMSVNFTGHAKLLKQVLPFLTSDAAILMLSSISAQRGSFDPIYAASKGAMLSFVKSVATQLSPGCRINALAPSLVEGSKMYLDMAPSRRDYHKESNPLGNLISIEDIARVAYDIVQPHWRHLNGACIDLNGGTYVR